MVGLGLASSSSETARNTGAVSTIVVGRLGVAYLWGASHSFCASHKDSLDSSLSVNRLMS